MALIWGVSYVEIPLLLINNNLLQKVLLQELGCMLKGILYHYKSDTSAMS